MKSTQILLASKTRKILTNLELNKRLDEALKMFSKKPTQTKVISTPKVIPSNSEHSSTTNIKTSTKGKVQQLTLNMKSGFLAWYPITWIILFANKIPIVKRILTLLRWYYGKTSIWKTLVIFRKFFIIINALIGVIAVLKVSGFGSESLMAGFAVMGNTYIEIIINMSKKLFYWFFDLLDLKVVPNIPSTPPSGSWTPNWWPGPRQHTWATRPMLDYLPDGNLDLAKSHNSPYTNFSNLSTPWYRDWHTYAYLIGGLCLVGGVCALGVIAYDWVTNPNSFFTNTIGGRIPRADGGGADAGPPAGGSGIALLNRIASGVNLRTISAIGIQTAMKLNPFYWIRRQAQQSQAAATDFDLLQGSMRLHNDKLYPFSSKNPHESYLDRIRHSLFGETAEESNIRWNMIYQMGKRNDRTHEDSINTADYYANFLRVIPETEGWKVAQTIREQWEIDQLRASLDAAGLSTEKIAEKIDTISETPKDIPSTPKFPPLDPSAESISPVFIPEPEEILLENKGLETDWFHHKEVVAKEIKESILASAALASSSKTIEATVEVIETTINAMSDVVKELITAEVSGEGGTTTDIPNIDTTELLPYADEGELTPPKSAESSKSYLEALETTPGAKGKDPIPHPSGLSSKELLALAKAGKSILPSRKKEPETQEVD